MRFLRPVPEKVRPTYRRLLSYSLLKAPCTALMAGLAGLIAVKSLGAPPWEIALLSAAAPFGNLLAILWSGRITKAPKVPYVFWPEIASSTVLILMYFARNPHVFTAALCLFLLLRAPMIQAYSAIMRANYPPQWRSSLLARMMALSEILIATVGLVFGFLLQLDPSFYRGLFPLAGAFGFLGAFQVGRVKVRGDVSQNNSSKNYLPEYSWRRILGILKHNHRFLRYEVAFFLFGFANIMTLPIIPLFLEHDLGITYSDAGLILVTLPMIIDILMLPLWGKTLDRRNPLLMRAIFNAVFSCGMLIYALATTLYIFAAGRAVIAFIQGGSVLVWVLGINYFAKREEVPVYMGLHQSLTGTRGLIAPFVGILLAHLFGSYRAVFLTSFFLMNLGTLVMVGEVIGEHRRTGGQLPSFAQIERQIDGRYSA